MRHALPRMREAVLDAARALTEPGRVPVCARDARLKRPRRKAIGGVCSSPGFALPTPRDNFFVGLLWALILVLATATGRPPMGEDASLPGGHGPAASAVRVVSYPLVSTLRLEGHTTVRSDDRPTSFSETARLDGLDGDDSDLILVPSRALAQLMVLRLSCLIDPRAVLAPAWTGPPASSSPVFPPLRC